MPAIESSITLTHFQNAYWTLEELQVFARKVGISTDGGKLNLQDRIKRFLINGKAIVANTKPTAVPDSAVVVIDDFTPVVSLKLDATTRQFFKSKIGPQFKFNQYLRNIASLENPRSLNLTYADLVIGWKEFEEKKKSGKVLKPQYQYQQFVKEFFSNPANKDKSMCECVSTWNSIKASAHRQYL